MALSRRGQVIASIAEKFAFLDILKNLWDPKTNPDGFVSLGVAENSLMHEELTDFINSSFKLETHHLTYGDGGCGSPRLRKAVAAFMNRHFHPAKGLEPEHVVVTGGATGALEHFGFLFGDGGEDACLLGRPFYHSFKPDMQMRAGVKIVEVAFGDVDPFGPDCIKRYEEALLEARKLVNVRALILCSPHNPLGRCYPRDTLVGLMKLCQKYQIHLLSDEIYALSVWKNEDAPKAEPFVSVLSIDTTGIIEPDLVHVIWGMSKDFGANGIRIGYIISQTNKKLRNALKLTSIYTYPSSTSDHASANILENFDFTDKHIETNSSRLADAYRFSTGFLRDRGIPFYPGANAGFFLWADLKRVSRIKPPIANCVTAEMKAIDIKSDQASTLDGQKHETTKVIMEALLKHKVFLASSEEFGGEEEGLFRIIFSQDRQYLEEGLRRIALAVGAESG